MTTLICDRGLRPSAVGALGRAVIYVSIALGIAIRAVQLVRNRSLSQDEAMFALNILHRSYGGLLHQLDFLQGAPPAFLWFEKAAVGLLGRDEYSLRLVPFLAGAAAIVLLAAIAGEMIQSVAVPIAVAMFALSDPLITWSVWAKPYAVDVFAAVALTWIGTRMARRPSELRWFVAFGAAALVALWFSFASVFVLASVSTAVTGAALLRRQWRGAVAAALASGPWLVCFAVFAFTLFRNLSDLQSLNCLSCPEQLQGIGMSSNSERLRDSLGEFRYVTGMPHVFERGGFDVGLVLVFVALVFCAFGAAAVWRRRPEVAVILVAPILFMLIAWWLDKYPVLGRTQLFLVPGFVLTFAEGVVFTAQRVSRSPRLAIAAAAGAIVIAIAVAGFGGIGPQHVEDVKTVLGYVARHERAGDSVYVYYTGQYQLRYYLECQCAGDAFEAAQRVHPWPLRPGPGGHDEFASALLSVPPRLIVGEYRGSNPSLYLADFDALAGRPRVWFLLSSLAPVRKSFLLRQLDERGTRRLAFTIGSGKDAAAAYLYDLRDAAS